MPDYLVANFNGRAGPREPQLISPVLLPKRPFMISTAVRGRENRNWLYLGLPQRDFEISTAVRGRENRNISRSGGFTGDTR